MGKVAGKVNPERRPQRFTREFKLEAVRLLELGQKSATQLALVDKAIDKEGAHYL